MLLREGSEDPQLVAWAMLSVDGYVSGGNSVGIFHCTCQDSRNGAERGGSEYRDSWENLGGYGSPWAGVALGGWCA